MLISQRGPDMNLFSKSSITRRSLLAQSGQAASGLSLLGLLPRLSAAESTNPLAPDQPHFAPKASRVIFLFMPGGASHVDGFDPKPELQKFHGRDASKDRIFAGSLWGNHRCGMNGTLISNLYPHLGSCIDDLCLIRSMHGDKGDHFEATLSMHSGTRAETLPGIGAWVSYGLGTTNPNLPSHVVFAETLPYAGAQSWDSNFLPACHQGTRITPGADPIPNLTPDSATAALQQKELDLLRRLNQRHMQSHQHDSTLAARIYSFDAATGLQKKAPEVLDFSDESDETLALYGIGRNDRKSFGWQCLAARRMSERGVRFIEIVDRGNWDAHSNMKSYEKLCGNTDQAIAGLLTDLKQRGLLDETLVVWCTEFGRTPSAPKTQVDGRDHYKDAFTCWLAGGGVKGGYVHGATDDMGEKITEDPVHIHDFHATIMHLLGFDHTKLTYHYSGRDFRLTGLAGNVIHDIIS
ncbi:MAG: DUF1501 domain-containing protein [Planctomyces sp.]|nr:DUF1501 domain-containing protein [Planctomyces sp.]